MEREEILAEVRRTADANGGRPLGRTRFAEATGINESVWSRHWVRWSEVCIDAGFVPNQRPDKVPDDELLEHLARLTRRLGKFPVNNEIRMEARRNETFPSHNTVARLGNKATMVGRLVDFCSRNPEYADVAELCGSVSVPPPEGETGDAQESDEGLRAGYVYLLKSGRHHKIGLSAAPGRREYEVALQMPEKVELVHSIKTDDMEGIERYWHRRFADRRANGEWFRLSAADVRAFKSRKTM